MPYTKEHKASVRQKIINTAIHEFKAHGVNEVSVPKIMKGAGLTHGGFYNHFANKEELVHDVIDGAVNSFLKLLGEEADRHGDNSRIEQVIEHYLSPAHRDNVANGCILPTLTTEIARSAPEVRALFTKKLIEVLAFNDSLLGKEHSDKSYALLSMMVGAIMLSRAVEDAGLSDTVLEQTKKYAHILASYPDSTER